MQDEGQINYNTMLRRRCQNLVEPENEPQKIKQF